MSPATATLLVFDLGTSYFKGTLFDTDGQLLALDRIPTPFTRSSGDYSEVSVSAFDDGLLALAQKLRQQAPEAYGTIAAVTFSTQTNSFVLLDADNEALTPFVIWNDRRAKTYTAALDRLMALPDFYETTGVPGLSPEFMVAKLQWYQTETPELWERVARIALISDYLTERFTGQFVTEAGAAGLTGLVNIHTLAWWPEALDIAGIEEDSLPDIVRAGSNLGPISADAAERFGLAPTCIFVVGCLDQYAGAIGAGNIAPGIVSETTGTVLATVRCADSFSVTPDSPVFWGPSAEAGRYYQMVFGDVSANLLEAFRNALPEPVDFDTLGALAVAATGTKLTLPRDLDTPELLDHVRIWATSESTGDAVRAIFLGVAETLRDQVTELCGADRPPAIHSVGGAAKSGVWMKIKADTLDVPFRAVACDEPTSLGAALLALHGIAGTSLIDLVARCVHLEAPIAPQ